MSEPPDTPPEKPKAEVLPARAPSSRPRGAGREGLDERQIRQIAMIGAIVLVASLLLVFIIENSDEVEVSFVFFSAEISLIWVIVLSAAAGAAIGAVVRRAVRRHLGR